MVYSYCESEVKTMNTMNDRIRALRKNLDLTQQEFANKLGLKRNSVASYEIGRSIPMEAVIISICREFDVNEEWLRTGEGEMFLQIPEEDETAALVYDLLGPDKESFYNIVLETIKAYKKLSPNSQKVINELMDNVIAGIKEKSKD